MGPSSTLDPPPRSPIQLQPSTTSQKRQDATKPILILLNKHGMTEKRLSGNTNQPPLKSNTRTSLASGMTHQEISKVDKPKNSHLTAYGSMMTAAIATEKFGGMARTK